MIVGVEIINVGGGQLEWYVVLNTTAQDPLEGTGGAAPSKCWSASRARSTTGSR